MRKPPWANYETSVVLIQGWSKLITGWGPGDDVTCKYHGRQKRAYYGYVDSAGYHLASLCSMCVERWLPETKAATDTDSTIDECDFCHEEAVGVCVACKQKCCPNHIGVTSLCENCEYEFNTGAGIGTY